MRGTEARLNSTTVNGERIPSPEAGTRDIALDTIPSDLLSSIEVTKALTPDMDGDSIGGTVNLVTSRAPENLRVSAGLGTRYREIVEETGGNGTFAYGQRFSDKKWGLLVSASFADNKQGSDNFEPEYDDGDLAVLELRDYTFERERYGVTADVDYRASNTSNYFLRGLVTNYLDTEDRRAKADIVEDGEIERGAEEPVAGVVDQLVHLRRREHGRREAGDRLPRGVEQVPGGNSGPDLFRLHPGGCGVRSQRQP